MSKAKRKTKFNISWKETYTWISVVRGDEFSANCNICNKKFSVHHGGISDIEGYHTFRLDRNEYGGGILLYV